jgi:hypothetical protein
MLIINDLKLPNVCTWKYVDDTIAADIAKFRMRLPDSLQENRWEICLSMREQNELRNCVEYTQRVFRKRHNRVNIAKCLYKINDCFMLKMDMI